MGGATNGGRAAADPGALHRRIAQLARPRLTGTAACAATRRTVRDALEGLGYTVRSLPFSYSAWPGLYGVSALGMLTLVAVGGAALLLARGHAGGALLLLVATFLPAAAALAATGAIIARLPILRRSGENLLATPGSPHRLLLVAHMDSKSQGVPTLGRTAAAAGAIVGWVAMAVLAVVGHTAGTTVLIAALPGLLGGVGLALGWTGDRSPGALDNATGLAALLELAARLHHRGDVAFLVTDAEELGLAGARNAAGTLRHDAVINLDGLDDDGVFLVMDRHDLLRRRRAPALAAAVMAAGEELGEPVRYRSLPPGLLCDHIPFAEAGTPAVTVMRGTLRSLLHVHRPGDHAGRLSGLGAARAVVLVEAAVRRLLESDQASGTDDAGPAPGPPFTAPRPPTTFPGS